MAYEVANGSSTIQADYELLGKIALHCSDCAQVTTNFNYTITDQLHILQNGNWEGDAAEQFFITMMHDVMPGFDRLIQSFQAGEITLNNLAALFQGADEEAAECLNWDGNTTDGGGGINSREGLPKGGNGFYKIVPPRHGGGVHQDGGEGDEEDPVRPDNVQERQEEYKR